MSVPARSATRRAAAAIDLLPGVRRRLANQLLGLARDLAQIDLRVLAPLEPPALDNRRLLLQRLVQPPGAIDVGRDEDQDRLRFRRLDVVLERVGARRTVLVAGVVGLALAASV